MSDFFRYYLDKNDLVAAPLAGYSHLPFRRILRKFFDGIVYSEMISVEGLSRRNAETMEYLDRLDYETPLVFQLFGGKAETYGEAIKVAEDIANIDAFDVNMGCPVKKVLKSGGGCALLGDLPRIKNIVANIRKSTDKPFSIKIRLGLDLKNLVYKEVLKIAENEGVNALIVHARTKTEMFSGSIHYEALQELAETAKIPIIGNGNVCSYDTYKQVKDTGVSGVMIGRSMMKAPWVFSLIKDKRNDLYSYLTPSEVGDTLLEMWEYMKEHAHGRGMKETHYMHVLRKFAVWFCKGIENSTDFRISLYKTNECSVVIDTIKDFFYGNKIKENSEAVLL